MKEKIKVLDSLEATRIKKPQYNGFLTGHGKHKNLKKYNRKQNRKLIKEMIEESK